MGITRNDAYPSKYLKHSDLDGKAITYTINHAVIEELGADKEKKPVVYFKEINRGLVLNRTNWDALEDLYGDESDAWAGKKLELFPTKTTFGSRRVDCIRVRAPAAQELNDAIPF